MLGINFIVENKEFGTNTPRTERSVKGAEGELLALKGERPLTPTPRRLPPPTSPRSSFSPPAPTSFDRGTKKYFHSPFRSGTSGSWYTFERPLRRPSTFVWYLGTLKSSGLLLDSPVDRGGSDVGVVASLSTPPPSLFPFPRGSM